MKIPRKVKIAGVLLGLLALVGLWQSASFFLFRKGYSKGSRTGVVRKISVKGPLYCKYLEGEMALQGGVPGIAQEIFRFTVDDESDSNPIVQALKTAEREGKRVTVDYRQDKPIWWRCNDGGKPTGTVEPALVDSHYYIVKVE
jgi:hypothetical protein